MGRIIKLSCPNCHSSDPEPTGGDHYRCAYCGTSFIYERDQPRVLPAAGTTPPRSPRMPLAARILLAAGIAAAVVGGALFAHLKMRPTRTAPGDSRRFRTTRSGRVDVPAIDRAQAKAPPPPKAALREIEHAKLARGSAIWLATLVNEGTVAIERPAVSVSLFDAAGRRVAERRGWAPIEVLPPGESSPVLVLITDAPAFAKAEVKPSNIEPVGDSRPRLAKLRVTEQTVRPYLRSHRKIIGTVRNEGPRTAQFVRVIVTGRDAAGKLVSFASGHATQTSLQPGATSGFEVTAGTFDIRAPTSYEVFAVGQQ